MKRIVRVGLLVLTCLAVCLPGQAATRLTDYALIVDGEQVELGDKTGYLYRSGKTMMVPVEALCDAMMLKCSVTDNMSALIEDGEGRKVSLRSGVKKVLVDGKYQKLRTKVVRQEGQILTADVRVLGMLGARYRQYPPAQARKLGYDGGALVVDTTGKGTELPDITPPEDVLPQEAAQAAKTASQIVTVSYNPSSAKAALSFYQKNQGKWYKQFATVSAYVGSAGIGKTKEGDKKTPSGTYNLGQPFGILESPGTSLGKYVKVSKYHYWCSTSGSKYYNQLVDTRKAADFTPTNADEKLSSIKPQYNYGIFIDYNKAGKPGKGSAIFLHCKGKATSTAGCVAVDQSVMKALLKVLKPGAKIVIY